VCVCVLVYGLFEVIFNPYLGLGFFVFLTGIVLTQLTLSTIKAWGEGVLVNLRKMTRMETLKNTSKCWCFCYLSNPTRCWSFTVVIELTWER